MRERRKGEGNEGQDRREKERARGRRERERWRRERGVNRKVKFFNNQGRQKARQQNLGIGSGTTQMVHDRARAPSRQTTLMTSEFGWARIVTQNWGRLVLFSQTTNSTRAVTT